MHKYVVQDSFWVGQERDIKFVIFWEMVVGVYTDTNTNT